MTNPYHLRRALDGDYTTSWETPSPSHPHPCQANHWLRVRLIGDGGTVERETSVYTRFLRIHVKPNRVSQLGGAEIHVKMVSDDATTDGSNSTRCAIIPTLTSTSREIVTVAANHAYMDIACNATGHYLSLIQPAAVCGMEILELEVVGRRHACTSCAAGSYEDQTGSTACKSCPWAWEAATPSFKTTSATASTSISDCRCDRGLTGIAARSAIWLLTQDHPRHRPALRIAGHNTSIIFNSSVASFLHAPSGTTGSLTSLPRAFRPSSSGLTVALNIKLRGNSTRSTNQSILDFGDGNAMRVVFSAERAALSGALAVRITQGGTTACSLTSSNETVVAGEWMKIVIQYDPNSTSMSLSKDGIMVAGPAACSGAPRDGNVTSIFLGKGKLEEGLGYLDGEIALLHVADRVLEDLSHLCTHMCNRGTNGNVTNASACAAAGTNGSSTRACSALQSSTKVSRTLLQIHKADKAVDGLLLTSAQSLVETTPWWRLDLQQVRFVASVRIQGIFDNHRHEPAGQFEIRVGRWPQWQSNAACASGLAPTSPQDVVDVVCHAEGRYVFIVAPGTDRSFSLYHVDVLGLRTGIDSNANGVVKEGEDCLGGCSGRQGHCEWCGSGMCCRKGWHDTSTGCDGSLGDDGKHVCVPAPSFSAVLFPNCTSCLEGTYKDSAGSEVCTLCDGGKYSTVQGSKELSECESCQAGKMQSLFALLIQARLLPAAVLL